MEKDKKVDKDDEDNKEEEDMEEEFFLQKFLKWPNLVRLAQREYIVHSTGENTASWANSQKNNICSLQYG